MKLFTIIALMLVSVTAVAAQRSTGPASLNNVDVAHCTVFNPDVQHQRVTNVKVMIRRAHWGAKMEIAATGCVNKRLLKNGGYCHVRFEPVQVAEGDTITCILNGGSNLSKVRASLTASDVYGNTIIDRALD